MLINISFLERGVKIVNLLIVDDNQEHLDFMYEVLKEEKKYSLFTTVSGAEVLEIIEKEDINIVLLDIIMPDMNGYEVCKQIRKNYFLKPMQIVLISGGDNTSDLDELLGIGADDFISKPVSYLELKARLHAALIRYRNQVEYSKPEFYQPKSDPDQRVSSLIAENVHLHIEFDKVRKMNQELEKNNQELEKLASLDTLSGLLNRRTLFQRIDMEIERSLRLGLPLTGIMMDIDHFKRVNDNFGHQCGDMIIREIGRRLKKTLRKYDYAGRYGGEEFFVIFPNTTEETALTISERFRKELEGMALDCNNEAFSITVSIGVAQFKPNETPASWIGRADKAMYIAKQWGRNRVTVG